MRDLVRVLEGLRSFLEHGAEITRVVPLSTGHSNETYLLEGLNRILRTPPSSDGLLPPYDMRRQHAVIASVRGLPGAPPVPEVFELCEDPAVIGAPFFVMERLPGEAFEYEVPAWLLAAAPEVRADVCVQWMGAVAGLHNLAAPPAFGPPRTPRDEAARWRDVAAGANAAELAAVLDELAKDPPCTSGPPAAVHGDPKLANCLWYEGRLTGLLDWELAYHGEPLADLGYMLWWFPEGPNPHHAATSELPGFWNRQQVIAAWEAATGRSARGVLRHEAAAIGKIAAIIAVGVELWRTGRSSDPRFEPWDAIVPELTRAVREKMAAS